MYVVTLKTKEELNEWQLMELQTEINIHNIDNGEYYK